MSTYLYGAFDCMFLSCHVRASDCMFLSCHARVSDCMFLSCHVPVSDCMFLSCHARVSEFHLKISCRNFGEAESAITIDNGRSSYTLTAIWERNSEEQM